MFGLKEKDIATINRCFARYPGIEQVILYGSRAKGNFRPGSDIDLTIVGLLEYGDWMKLENELDDLLLPYKIDLSIKDTISNPDLIAHIERVGQVFYEKAGQGLSPLFSFLLLFLLFLTSCQTGYQKENGTWVWVTYDENSGKRAHSLAPVDNRSFEVLSDKKYARDKDRVFFNGRPIKHADPASFEVLNKEGYARDRRRVFLECFPLVGADPNAFEYLEYPYSRDKEHVYCGILPLTLDKSEVPEFRVTNTDRLMSGMRTTTVLWHFIEMNPEYQWLDTLGLEHVIVGNWATGETSKRKFKGFKEIK